MDSWNIAQQRVEKICEYLQVAIGEFKEYSPGSLQPGNEYLAWPPIILRRLGLDVYRYINGYRRYKRAFR